MGLNTLIIITAASYSGFLLILARAAGRIDPLLCAVFSNCVAAVLPLALYYYFQARGATPLPATSGGIFLACAGGVLISVFAVLTILIFQKDGVSYAAPLIYGLTVVIMTAAGGWLFKESLPPLQLAGTAVVIVGLGLITWSRYAAQG